MRDLSLPDPPNPNDPVYSKDMKLYNQAMYKWASTIRSQLQIQHRTNSRPAAQNFVVSNYTAASTLTGTDTTTNVAEVLCTLIQALISKNILKTNIINQ